MWRPTHSAGAMMARGRQQLLLAAHSRGAAVAGMDIAAHALVPSRGLCRGPPKVAASAIPRFADMSLQQQKALLHDIFGYFQASYTKPGAIHAIPRLHGQRGANVETKMLKEAVSVPAQVSDRGRGVCARVRVLIWVLSAARARDRAWAC